VVARRLSDRLQNGGVRCWLDEHQLRPGQDIYEMVDRTLRATDRVLLCVSEASLTSWWVQDEIERTLQREKEIGQHLERDLRLLVAADIDGSMSSGAGEAGVGERLAPRVVAELSGLKDDSSGFEEQVEAILVALP
jgi:hypothetical protein